MSAAAHIELLSVEEYLAREENSTVRHEYLGGNLYAMAGARNVHNIIAGTFYGLMFGRLRGKRCQPFNTDTKVRIKLPTHTRFYYPDGLIVCDQNPPSDTFQDQPVVVAEVISEDTRRTDEGEKRDAYMTIPSLTDYLVIETDLPRVVVHHRTDNGFVSHVYEGMEAVIPLESIGVELPLAELYERVQFNRPVNDEVE